MYKKSSAFSLIELSIVLIIIGLLVAGVVGGRSLIDSARQRSFMNEMENYKKGFYIYKAAKGIDPGLENRVDSCLTTSSESCSGLPLYVYPSDDDSPYKGMSITPNNYGFVDLYLEKIMDFNSDIGEVSPRSNAYKGLEYHTFYTFTGTESYRGNFTQNITPGQTFLFIQSKTNDESKSARKPFRYVDEKLDDGFYNSGSIRAACTSSTKTNGYASYDEAINDPTGSCNLLLYRFN